jgi:hypothetical protein
MKRLWPDETSIGNVFDDVLKPDPFRGKRIEDKYSLTTYGDPNGDGTCATWCNLKTLGITSHTLLRVLDPDEYERIEQAAEQRAWANAKTDPHGPQWIMSDDWDEDEEAVLKRAGLTVEEAQKMVDDARESGAIPDDEPDNVGLARLTYN